jgi:hypothetical protein
MMNNMMNGGGNLKLGLWKIYFFNLVNILYIYIKLVNYIILTCWYIYL